MRWVNGGGRSLPGLVRRRQAEGALFVRPMPRSGVEAADEAPEELLPQVVTPEVPGVMQVTKESRTIQASVMGLGGVVLSFWDAVFGVAKDAGKEVLTNQEVMTPFSALLTQMQANVGLIASGIILVSLVVVIVRRYGRETA